MPEKVTTRGRWLGALCYLSFFVFLSMLAKDKSPFLAKHCRQGFALFFAEVVAVLFIAIFDSTVGQIPVLGFLVAIILRLAFFLGFLLLSIMGFNKAMFGEEWAIPYLDELADRVPVESRDYDPERKNY
jgi:uncharacterized membrane protein